MKIIYTEPFRRDYQNLPPNIQRALAKALKFLLTNPRYPSLRAKKLPGTQIWYARVTKAYRFTFHYLEDTLFLRRVGTHYILDQERKH